MGKFTYLLLDLGSVLVPLLFSFEKRLGFYKQWKHLFPAITITAAFFIVWDHFLTVKGVWGFNHDYVVGIWLWDLPLEEWLFFFLIPYSCMFIYASLNVLVPHDPFGRSSRNITAFWFVVVAATAVTHIDRYYTGIKLSLTACILLLAYFRNYPWLGKFYRAYLVSLIPFLAVNGVLTSLPVVWYNDSENLGIRIFTIPVEDTQYTLLMLLMNTVLFEYFRGKSTNHESDKKFAPLKSHD